MSSAWLSGDVVRAQNTVDLTLPGSPRPTGAPAPSELKFAGAPHFRAGQVLILGATTYTPGGLIADVTGVSAGAAGTTITYTQGGLMDAHRSLTLVAQLPAAPTIGRSGRSQGKARVADVTPVNTTYGPTYSGGTGDVTLAPSVTGNISYSFHPYVTLVITIATKLGVIPTGVEVYFAVDGQTSLKLDVTGGASWSASHTFGLGHKILDAFDVGPIVLTPEIAASLTITGSAAAQATLERSISEDAHVGMTLGARIGTAPYIVGDRNNGFHRPVIDSNSPPNITVKATADAKLTLEFSLDIYGAVGPDAKASAEVDTTVDPSADPWWHIDASGDFSIGIDLNALNIGLLTKVLKLLHIPTNPSWTLGHLGPYTLLSAGGPFTGTVGSPGVPGRGGLGPAGGPGTGTPPGAYPSGTPGSGGAPAGATVILNQGPIAPAGYRYAITLVGFAPNSPVSIECYDSVSPSGFFSFALTTNFSGGAAISSNSCYSGDGPDHWVTANSVSSNHVTWGVSSGPQPPPPPANASIQIGWSSAHPSWITMTMNGFSPGSYTYSCDFGSGGDQSFTLSETSEPETWDNGHTCYDGIRGDTVWVTINGVKSNVITVP